MRRALVAVAGALVVVPGVARAADPSPVPVVEVRNNFFDPETVRVAAGGTVRWTVVDGGHTVTAADGRFDFPASGTLPAGSTVTWAAGPDERLSYFCRIHGNEGMVGSIVVGSGGPQPPPDNAPVLDVPSARYPTVGSAVAAAAPGSTVRVAAGKYDEAVEVVTPGVTVEGVGADAVVFDGGYRRDVGIAGSVGGLVVRGITFRRYLTAGVSVSGLGSRVEDVVVIENEGAGIDARAGVVVQRVEARGNRIGVRASGGGYVVRQSRLERNRTGILVSAPEVESAGAPYPAGGDVLGNTIVGDQAGIGVWVAGAWGVRVRANTVEATGLGIVVSVTAVGVPRAVEVVDNRVSASIVDLAYDGAGVDNCFAGNARPDGSPPTAEPVVLPTVSDCNGPHAVGVPDPLVHVLLQTA